MNPKRISGLETGFHPATACYFLVVKLIPIHFIQFRQKTVEGVKYAISVLQLLFTMNKQVFLAFHIKAVWKARRWGKKLAMDWNFYFKKQKYIALNKCAAAHPKAVQFSIEANHS